MDVSIRERGRTRNCMMTTYQREPNLREIELPQFGLRMIDAKTGPIANLKDLVLPIMLFDTKRGNMAIEFRTDTKMCDMWYTGNTLFANACILRFDPTTSFENACIRKKARKIMRSLLMNDLVNIIVGYI